MVAGEVFFLNPEIFIACVNLNPTKCSNLVPLDMATPVLWSGAGWED